MSAAIPVGARQPIECSGWRGYRYAPLPPALTAALPTWLVLGRVEGGAPLRSSRTFRWQGYFVKFTRARSRLRDRWRPAAAIRAADLHARLLPLRTPRPLLALERRMPGRAVEGLLVTEFVSGRSLKELHGCDERAEREFARFLADMHTRNRFHGDPHVDNFLWDGGAWLLLDLEGLRHPLRSLLRERLVSLQWARVCFDLCDADGVRTMFAEYQRARERSAREQQDWRRVLTRLERLRAERCSR